MYGDFGSPLYNQHINPYMYAQNPYQQQPKQDVVKVNGENGARAFPIGANSSALLLDETGEIVWLVVTDGAGYKTVMPYDITPHKVAPAPDFTTLEQRIERLEGIINANTTNTSTTRNESRPAEPEFLSTPKVDERSQERTEWRSPYAAGDREQPSVQSSPQRNAGTGWHAQGSFYEQSKVNGDKRERDT